MKKMTDASEIRKMIRAGLENNSVLVGANESLKALRAGKAKLVVYATNCPPKLKNDIDYYKNVAGQTVIAGFDGNSVELGTFCGKPFTISVLAVTA